MERRVVLRVEKSLLDFLDFGQVLGQASGAKNAKRPPSNEKFKLRETKEQNPQHFLPIVCCSRNNKDHAEGKEDPL
jgi:hypothetical protein